MVFKNVEDSWRLILWGFSREVHEEQPEWWSLHLSTWPLAVKGSRPYGDLVTHLGQAGFNNPVTWSPPRWLLCFHLRWTITQDLGEWLLLSPRSPHSYSFPPCSRCRKSQFVSCLVNKNAVAFQEDALLFLLHKHLKNQHFPLSTEPKLTAGSI